mgnify:CR=1 FL=1
MIDKYKRAKAARQISEKVVDAKGFDDSKPTHLAFLDGHVDGFNAGAKWMQEEFLKDLWHPASEMPDKNRTCLVRVVYHPNHGMLQDEERIEQSSFHDFGWYDYDFKYIGTNYDIVSWLYISDLLPKEGGEQ